ncbi:MAG: hypothetical protein JSS11_13115 [Verrucomicrobia bacterium]|nr:hypothetical protein [Verrucomicrobiota bacterium]
MTQYLLLIQGNATSPTTPAEWDRFFAAARASGLFQGGSAVGRREFVGDTATARSTAHITGYMRFDSAEKQPLLDLLKLHPVVLHGGTVELCELPKT